MDRQLLAQLGERLKRVRVAQGLTTTEMASRAGISRMTLSAVEAGEPSPTMGSYVRVMNVLDVSKDLVLLASGTLQPPDATYDLNVREFTRLFKVTATNRKHELQDLQSLVLHQAAVQLMRKDSVLIQQVLDTLERWREAGDSHSRFLWDEWAVILHRKAWRKALAHTKRSKELRQASPLTTILPAQTRQWLLDEVKQLKAGVPLGSLSLPKRERERGTERDTEPQTS